MSSSSSSSSSSSPLSRAQQQRQHVQRVLQHRDNYYDILGIARNAEPAVVRRSYYATALYLHPDKNPRSDGRSSSDDNDAADAAEAFRLLHEAYTTLSDARRRAVYDMLGAQSARDYDALADMNIDARAVLTTVASMLAFAVLYASSRRALAEERLPSVLTRMFGAGGAHKLSDWCDCQYATRHAAVRRVLRQRARRTLLLALVIVVAVVVCVPRAPAPAPSASSSRGVRDVSTDDEAVLLRRGARGWFVRPRSFAYHDVCTNNNNNNNSESNTTHVVRVLRFRGTDADGRAAFARHLAKRCDTEAALLSASRERYAATARHDEDEDGERAHIVYNDYAASNRDGDDTKGSNAKATTTTTTTDAVLRRRYARKTWQPRYTRLPYTVRSADDMYTPSALCRAHWACHGTRI